MLMGVFLVELTPFVCWSWLVDKMAGLDDLLELLSTLITSTIDSTVKICKPSLVDIRIYLENAQDKNEFLQLESQLQQKRHHFELVFVHNNALFESKFDSYQ